MLTSDVVVNIGGDDTTKMIPKMDDTKPNAEERTSDVFLFSIGSLSGKDASFYSPSTKRESAFLNVELSRLSNMQLDDTSVLEPVGVIYAVKKNNILEDGTKI